MDQPKVSANRQGHFLIKFSNSNDVNLILQSGPYSMGGRPVMVTQWSTEFDFQRDVLMKVPIWVKMHNLPLNCWSLESLSRITSVVGVPICVDKCIAEQQRISYPRVLVEVNMIQVVQVKGPRGEKFAQKVTYEWFPYYCKKCCELGHSCADRAPLVVE